ncbi:MAG: DUF438 domain-containing protein [Candidatus Lokiarchaeota archaeon]|nr:DUF438 domain-containing protein [Candidatus Lokiarchaeota archaeon]
MNQLDRIKKLKKIIIDLHDGKDIEDVKREFKESFENISADQIAQIEQELIEKGDLTPEQITKLCDVHLSVFKEALPANRTEETSGHPFYTYQKENKLARKLIQESREKFRPLKLMKLAQIEIHYTRLENQLFPILESKGFSGPCSIMWAKHDDIRKMIKERDTKMMDELLNAIEEMIDKEEKILFPVALEKLSDDDWARVKQGEEEIGFAFGIKPGNEWKPMTIRGIHSIEIRTTDLDKEKLNLNVGKLTVNQINRIFMHLPVDISFVNEKDEVMYYSDIKDRIFPRSPAVIGRKVQNCHPPKSQHIVNRILEAFKSGEKEVAEFWMDINGIFVHIRYFAIRDERGKYVGTLEVSQDITHIRKIAGQRRLLDWNNENKS